MSLYCLNIKQFINARAQILFSDKITKNVKVTINKLILGQFSFFSKQFWYNLKILIVYENSVCLLL